MDSLIIYIIIGVLSLLGLWLCVAGIRRLWRRRAVTGSLQGLTGLLFLSLAGLIVSVAINLYTYQRMTFEAPVAEVRFESISPQNFRVYVIPENLPAQVFELRGDEWQIDTRIIKWKGFATFLGMDTSYRLERLSGRYHDIKRERNGPRSVHSLDQSQGLDIWRLARDHKDWLPWMDAVYGSAAYMPMADKARFKVTMSQSGLVVRPENAIAEQAVQNWR